MGGGSTCRTGGLWTTVATASQKTQSGLRWRNWTLLSRVSAQSARTESVASMSKRGYSREFTPKTERRVRFEVDRIPPTLYDSVKAKARREGVSLRTLTLRLWSDWLAGPATEDR